MNFTAHLVLSRQEPITAPVYKMSGEVVETITLPQFFNAPLREELVKKAFIHLQSHSFQPKGASKLSGHKHSVESWGPGFGMARIARVKGRGTPKYGAGGMVPSAVGGRPTHPPVPEKRIHKELNKKELKLAFISALAFTARREYVVARGHRLPASITTPIIVEDGFESVEKAREVKEFLLRLGLGEELKRASQTKVRPGKGKMRGRRYKRRRGPLIVVSTPDACRAARNIPGVDVVSADKLSVLHLAPGGVPGRLTIFTKKSLKALEARMS